MTALTNDVQHEGDEAVVGGQGQQNPINQQDVLEVVDDALAVQKVHGGAEEVPVQRLGEAQAAGLAGDVGYRNDLLEADDLDGGDDHDDVEVAGAEGKEEAPDHDQRPGCAHDEVGLLLLILALLGDGRRLGGLSVSGGDVCLTTQQRHVQGISRSGRCAWGCPAGSQTR